MGSAPKLAWVNHLAIGTLALSFESSKGRRRADKSQKLHLSKIG
ncbi:hypothetical protein QUB68_21090 [Microcoleus sp. A006_D1]